MNYQRHADTAANRKVDLFGVTVKVFELDTGRRLFRKTFTSLDDERDARKCFDEQVAALKARS